MADPKDTNSFFRKVVKFVANPSTEWGELGSMSSETRDTEFAKHELKAMIERKRRNDFVRKREFDMLRKVRREGLTSEQLAALGGSSRLDDSEVRNDSGAKPDSGVKAKIDEIEQQMVSEGYTQQRRSSDFYNAPTQPVPMAADIPTTRPSGGRVDDAPSAKPAPAHVAPNAGLSAVGAVPQPAAARQVNELPLLEMDSTVAGNLDPAGANHGGGGGVEVVHDPELDEAVIAFANADFDSCEQSLQAMLSPQGGRVEHADSWLVLFDLYRAIGQQSKFESLAMDYAQRFGTSAPQYFSMPRLVAEAASTEDGPRPAGIEGQVGWASPEWIDADAVARLRSQTLQMPLPWVFDWNALKGIDVEGCAHLSELFRVWMPQKLDMRWLGGDKLFSVLADAAPTGVRDTDPAYWQLRLDALRMTNRPDQFDESAIDYCVTYEVSPPSWEPVTCQVRVSGGNMSTTSPPMSVVSEVSTSFVESQILEDHPMIQMASVELSGQLVGDIAQTLARMNAQLGSATVVTVSCTKLIRVDFIAAGDLLNWVLARRSENRSVSFSEAHRLVAMFFGAMGINEHARVKVRTV